MLLSIVLGTIGVYVILFSVLGIFTALFRCYERFADLSEKINNFQKVIFPWVTAILLSVAVSSFVLFIISYLIKLVA